jgi:predicted ATPase/transcriptional regulator with XRE-family HTH domain/Tfp pilus assembly protein PilF
MEMASYDSFGGWIKQRRSMLDLTQDELARQVGCSVETIYKLEADQRRPSKPMAERLAAVLAVPMADRAAFIHFSRTGVMLEYWRHTHLASANGVDAAPSQPPPTLPVPLSSFVGRTDEIEVIGALLRDPNVRLLTLTGAPGIGKTRLALQVAASMQAYFGDGVVFVALDSLSAPTLVLPQIASMLKTQDIGIQPSLVQVQAYLRDKHLLLVLDNFEHLLKAAPLVTELLAAVPQVTVLVTSRRALHVSGEYEYHIPPLAIPDLTQLPALAQLAQSPSVALFLTRAQAVKLGFALTRKNAYAIAAICERLDGVPLTIELAAAWMRVLSPAALLARLDSRLPLLTGGMQDLPPRQRTLRATLDWSYHLLSLDQQHVFTRISVFVGGFTLEAAEAVTRGSRGDERELGSNEGLPLYSMQHITLDAIAALLDHSLVGHTMGVDDEPRFRMLAVIREYALEHLWASGEYETIHHSYADYYLTLAEAAEPELYGPNQRTGLARLEAEHDNFRAVLGWAIAQEHAALATRLSGALGRFWMQRGYLSEGRRWLTAVLALREQVPAAARAKALRGAAGIAWAQGDYTWATVLLEECLTIQRTARDQRAIATVLRNLGLVVMQQGDYARAQTLYKESLALLQELGDTLGIAGTLGNLGLVVMQQGDYARAQTLYRESLVLLQELGDTQGIAGTLGNLGLVAWYQRDEQHARAYHAESLALFQELGDQRGVAFALSNIGMVELVWGNVTAAATLIQESLHLRHKLGDQEGIAMCLEGLALVAGVQGYAGRAAVLGGAAATLRETIGSALSPPERSFYERTIAVARDQFDALAWAAAWAEGQAMPLDQAIDYGLIGDEALPGTDFSPV